MNIDVNDLLTKEHKKELGEALFQKLLVGIEQLEFSKSKKITVSNFIQAEIDEAFSHGFIASELDCAAIGRKITAKIIGGLGE